MAKGWLIGGAVLLGVLLIASIAVALLEREESLPEGTPEAAVQDFLRVVQEDNFELAYSFLSEELKEDCSIQDFAGGITSVKDRLEDNRITLENTRTVEGSAFVTVRMTRFHGSGVFGSSESSFEQRFILRQEEGHWRFTEYPWPFHWCGERKPVPHTHPPEPAPTTITSTPTPPPTP